MILNEFSEQLTKIYWYVFSNIIDIIMTASLVRVAGPFLEEVLFWYVDEFAIDFNIYSRFIGKTKITSFYLVNIRILKFFF